MEGEEGGRGWGESAVGGLPVSMLTCVMGFPAAGYTGFALMSILELLAAAAAWSAEGTGSGFCSSFAGAGFAETSPEAVL